MPRRVVRSITVLLVLVHVGLGVWAAAGLAELALPQVPWARISNPMFSRAMLLWQWALVATAATVFIAGTRRRSPRLPEAMLVVYGAMALTCAYQTFFILTNAGRFTAMAVEYLEYTAILVFLFATRTRPP